MNVLTGVALGVLGMYLATGVYYTLINSVHTDGESGAENLFFATIAIFGWPWCLWYDSGNL